MEIQKGVNRLEIKCNIKFYFIQGFGFSLSTIITGILFVQSLLNLNKINPLGVIKLFDF